MKLTMQLGPRSYDIILKKGALGRAGMLTNLGGKVLLVSDKGVPAKYVRAIARQCGEAHTLILPQGEGAKSVESWQAILSRMLEQSFGRGDVIAAVGGGVVGDVAGFAAATYMRGIGWCQFPTTTMAQVDASIGGKTALDLGGVKNVVGAFHQPSIVIADPDTLATLPPRHYANGMAEALKTALVGSTPLFEIMEKEDIGQNAERIIYLAMLFKKGVVERDETDHGERRLLNFGHTVGHAIEAACGLGTGGDGLLHGECVALGMLPMIESRSLLRRTRAVMRKLGLPLRHRCPTADILRYMQNDKKRGADGYTVVRVKTLGQGYLETISYEELALLVGGEAAP